MLDVNAQFMLSLMELIQMDTTNRAVKSDSFDDDSSGYPDTPCGRSMSEFEKQGDNLDWVEDPLRVISFCALHFR
jgi:hypothetical protein